MKLSKLPSVDAAIRTLDDSDKKKVSAWFERLENWENDLRIRKMVQMIDYRGVYVLNTSDDIRIFLKLDPSHGEISIIDIAKPSRFEMIPVASE